MIRIFISYRRTQTFVVDRIHERICAEFRPESVFLDRPDFKPGVNFPERTRQALDTAKIVLVIIDPTWASVQDPVTLERRLTREDDWVRIEVESGLKGDKIVIPVLIEGAEMPTAVQLPESIADLRSRQSIEIHGHYFAEDMNKLVAEMRSQIAKAKLQELLDDDSHPYPRSRLLRPIAIEGEELEKMKADLPRWEIVESPIKDDTRTGAPETRVEIVRRFKFPSFLDAIAFMSDAAQRIDPYQHHPRWENLFKTVRVYLSTWDSGHIISDRDYKTAQMLEHFYKDFIEDLWDNQSSKRL